MEAARRHPDVAAVQVEEVERDQDFGRFLQFALLASALRSARIARFTSAAGPPFSARLVRRISLLSPRMDPGSALRVVASQGPTEATRAPAARQADAKGSPT